jgi:lipoprotein-releasing system ATP-binding protein
LLNTFTVIENVAMPLFKVLAGDPEEARRRTEALLAFTGIMEAAESKVEELPVRVQHRVASRGA